MAKSLAPQCSRCNGDGVLLRRQIAANGVNQFGWWCEKCERWAVKGKPFLSHGWLQARNIQPNEIPIIADYSHETPCVICGEPGELHHWAPQALNNQGGEEWHRYPTEYLCRYHHRLWHMIVTPELAGVVQKGTV
jgi:hypothetical protein